MCYALLIIALYRTTLSLPVKNKEDFYARERVPGAYQQRI